MEDKEVFKAWTTEGEEEVLYIEGYSYISKLTGVKCYGFDVVSSSGEPQMIPDIGLMTEEAVIDFVERFYTKSKSHLPPEFIQTSGGIIIRNPERT